MSTPPHSTPVAAAGRSATGYISRQAPVNLMRNFTLENVIRAIENGRDINEVDPRDGMTILMEAVARNKEDIVEYLIDTGADLDIFDHEGMTALLYYQKAMYKEGNPEKSVQMLLEGGALLLPDNDGQMPLYIISRDYDYRLEELQSSLNSYSNNNNYSGNRSFISGPGRIISNGERKYQEREDEKKALVTAWRASVSLAALPSDAIEYKENPRTLLRYRNIRDLIKLYSDRNVIEINLYTMSSSKPAGNMQIDVRMPVYILKKIITFFFNFNFKFELLVPTFGNRKMDDERAVSDYGIRNGGRLLIAPKMTSGFTLTDGGTRKQKRKQKRNRRNKTRVSKR